MAIKAKPWVPQYPRRKDGTGKDIQEILHTAVKEAMQTFLDIYKIDANEQKRQFIKADANRFLNPEVFLEEETPQN